MSPGPSPSVHAPADLYASRPWTALYPSDMPTELRAQHDTMLDAWLQTLETVGDGPWLHYHDATMSAAQVDAAADALAVALIERGLGHGDRVALLLQNDPAWPVCLLAVWKAGGIAVGLNPMFRGHELAYHLRDCGASVLIALSSLVTPAVADAIAATPVEHVITSSLPDPIEDRWLLPDQPVDVDRTDAVRATEALADLIDGHSGQHPDSPNLTGSATAMLTYTSGTTGPPKGAMNTHGNVAHNCQVLAEWFSLDRSDTVLGVAPLFHVTGSVAHIGVSMHTGARLVLFHRFDPVEALRLISRWHVTFCVGALTAYIALLDAMDPSGVHDLSSLRRVASGGAPVNQAVVDRFEARTGVYIQNAYGLTETTSPSHLIPVGARAPVDPTSGAVSIGIPTPGCDVSVVDPQSREAVPAGELGELTISGPMVVPGYWDKPDETRHAIPDGRLHTGDIGFMDEQGWFYIVDRAKEQINAGGYKVWPREVEDILYRHPAVREAAVVGVPDEYRGETVKAYVSLHDAGATTPDQLIAFCREHLAAYKYPRSVQVMDELPKTASGKILRRVLRDERREEA